MAHNIWLRIYGSTYAVTDKHAFQNETKLQRQYITRRGCAARRICTAPICRAAHSYMPCSTCLHGIYTSRHIFYGNVLHGISSRHIIFWSFSVTAYVIFVTAYPVLSFDTHTAYLISSRHKRGFLHGVTSYMPCSTILCRAAQPHMPWENVLHGICGAVQPNICRAAHVLHGIYGPGYAVEHMCCTAYMDQDMPWHMCCTAYMWGSAHQSSVVQICRAGPEYMPCRREYMP